MSAEPWYAAGLRFSCARCGGCCTGEPGYVWLEAGEAEALAELLGETAAAFRASRTRRVWGRVSLTERADGSCVLFAAGTGCLAYERRPRQCRTWPFWERSLSTPATWERQAAECPGMGTGELYDCARIEALLRQRGLPDRGDAT